MRAQTAIPRNPVYINAPADSPVRTALQCHGQFACPRQLTNVAADSPVCTGLPRRGRFTHERLQLHLAIINFMEDYFWPSTSGDIHLKYILLAHIVFVKEQVYLFLGLQYCLCRAIIYDKK